MRGKDRRNHQPVTAGRITPAYAGKSIKTQKDKGRAKDHPRVCGEKMMKAGSNCAMLGSPPRMQGKVSQTAFAKQAGGITPAYAGKSMVHLHHRCFHLWITPAYAGKSATGCRRLRVYRDHPRVCGEKRYSRPLHGTPLSLEALRYTCRTRLPSRPRSCCMVRWEISSSGKRS